MISEAVLSGAVQGGVSTVICILMIKYILPKLDRLDFRIDENTKVLSRVEAKIDKCDK